MSRIEFRDLISLEESKNRLRKVLNEKKDMKRIDRCNGDVLAEDVYSDLDVPGFDRAAMDGYAVKASDTFRAEEDNPISLEKIGELMPGEVKDFEVNEEEAVEVATGAVLPKGANAVVMIEYIDELSEEILVRDAVAPDENIMYAGSDIMAGEKVLSKGDPLNPRDIGVLAAIGKKKVEVYSDLKVGVISIGEELVSPDQEPNLGQIFDTNSFSLRAALREVGAEPNFYGIVGDDKELIEKKIKKAAKENDLVFTSGSTSAGSSDLLHSVLEKGEILFHGVAIKPGKPTLAAKINNSILIGLPGYPTSALTIYKLLIDPLIRELLGKVDQKKEIKAIAATKIRSTSGRRHFHPVGLVKREKDYLMYPIEKGSGAITSLSQAEGFIEIKENQNYVKEGTKKSVWLFSEKIELPDILFMGSHCIGIDLIRKKLPGSSKSINVGSSGGFRLMKKKIPDVSGVHLLSENGEYNHPFIKEYDLNEAILIKGYLREQGLIVKKGNPMNINSLVDLVNKPVKLINRNKGSGTRKLLDLKLKEISNKKEIDLEKLKEKISGYRTGSRTHSGVASAIKLNKADVGLGNKYFAEKNKLDFIKISEEEYDFLINKESLNKPIINEFIDYLKSKDFKNEINKLSGIKAYRKTGKQIK